MSLLCFPRYLFVSSLMLPLVAPIVLSGSLGCDQPSHGATKSRAKCDSRLLAEFKILRADDGLGLVKSVAPLDAYGKAILYEGDRRLASDRIDLRKNTRAFTARLFRKYLTANPLKLNDPKIQIKFIVNDKDLVFDDRVFSGRARLMDFMDHDGHYLIGKRHKAMVRVRCE